MFLSKFIINCCNPSARQALADAQDFHRNLMARFQSGRQEAGVLYRLDLSKKEPVAYVRSKYPPMVLQRTDMSLAGSQPLDSMISEMKNGRKYAFDICTIPSKKVTRKGKKNSARITLSTETKRLEWLHRKAQESGFQILTVQEMNQSEAYGRHGADNIMHLRGYHYQGQLLVEDEKEFRRAYCEGIGPDKAYGYGMLLLI